MAPKKASSKADEAAKAALLAAKKGKALALTHSTHQEATEDDVLRTRKDDALRTCGPEGQPQPPPGFAPPEGTDLTEDGEVLGVSAEEQLQLRALRIKNRNLQRQKEILEAKHQRVSALAKVRQMIRDEEQKVQDLEREITLMQREGHLGLQYGPPLQQRAQLEDIREGHLGLQHGPPLQQRAQMEDLHFPQRDHAFPHAAPFQGVNYLDERSPLAPHLQVTPWPANFRAGTYPKYNGSTDPAQYIMSYQVAVASSGGDDATMAKSFIIALEGPALTWFTRLPPLSIDSWRSLRDKFLLNFQGYRPDTDALAELSLCKQLEKETLREYYRKFLTLKSQLPSVDDQIAIHYAISGLRAGVLYSHCIRDPPKNLQELYQLFEKYAKSEELHQRKVESQRKPKDAPQSSRTWTRTPQPDSGRDGRNQQQVHNIANQHPAGDAPRRQEYPPRAAEMEHAVRAGGACSRRADSTVFSTAKTAPTKPKIAQRRRPPGIGWHGHNRPTTLELSRTLISNTLHHTSTPPPRIHRTTHTNTTRKYKSYLPHPHLHTSNNKTSTPTPQSKKTSPISRIAKSFI
jgi:hypothetical protein